MPGPSVMPHRFPFFQTLRPKSANSHLIYGVPFLCVFLGTSYVLSFLTQARFDRHDSKQMELSPEKIKRHKTRPMSLQEEYFRLGLDTEKWDMVRHPRPEEPSSWQRTDQLKKAAEVKRAQ